MVAVLAVLGFLLVIALVITAPEGVSIDWGLYLIIAFTALQAIVAVAALLFDAGVITPPAPRPKYDQQQQYGQYGGPGGYYGTARPARRASRRSAAAQQRPGYPSQYGGHPGGPSTGGFSALPQSGPPTPPTGFPAYGQPQAVSSAPTTQVPAQPQQSSSTPTVRPERPSGNSPAARVVSEPRARSRLRGTLNGSGQPASRYTPGA